MPRITASSTRRKNKRIIQTSFVGRIPEVPTNPIQLQFRSRRGARPHAVGHNHTGWRFQAAKAKRSNRLDPRATKLAFPRDRGWERAPSLRQKKAARWNTSCERPWQSAPVAESRWLLTRHLPGQRMALPQRPTASRRYSARSSFSRGSPAQHPLLSAQPSCVILAVPSRAKRRQTKASSDHVLSSFGGHSALNL